METLRHPIAGLVIFGILCSLLIVSYTSIEDSYGITKGDVKTLSFENNTNTGNVLDHLKEMNLIEGINALENSILKLGNPTGGGADILGALASLGVGTLKLVTGIITAPYTIFNIIITFYGDWIPHLLGGLIVIIVVYVGFILLSAYLKERV